MHLSPDISKRISLLRPILIVGVVFLHVPGVPTNPSELNPTLANLIVAFFQNGVFRGTVPTMSLIAGYLLFSAGLDQAPRKLLTKKFMTLLVPFVIFNLACFAFMEAMNQVLGDVFPWLAKVKHSVPTLIDPIFGLSGMPIDGPLHFVRDMIVAILLAPAFGVAIRRAPWAGGAAIVLIFGSDLDGHLILRASSLLLFYIGGVMAVYQWNLAALDRYAEPLLALFFGLCAAVIVFRIDNNVVLVMVAPFLIWPSVALLQNAAIAPAIRNFSKYSFFIFSAHMPILYLTWWAVDRHARWIPYPVYWVLAPICVIALLKVVFDVLDRVAPTALAFAIGARTSVPVSRERRKTPRPAGAPVYSADFRLRQAGATM